MAKTRRLEHLLEAPWALFPQTLTRIVEWGRAEVQVDPSTIVALDGSHDVAPRVGSVAVIPVYGVIEHHSDWLMELFGGTSVDGLRESLRGALNDPDVKAIVLDIDSPGGTVAGITELAAEIREARGGAKPIIAAANAFAASAAYWLASQADELVVTPSGQVGSIGVYAVPQDLSGMLEQMGVDVTLVSAGPHKTEGNEFEPLSDEAREALQERVDASYNQFVGDVAAGRRVSAEQVKTDFGGGRVLSSKKALAAGMVDRIETLGETIQRLGKASARRRIGMAAAASAESDLPFHSLLDEYVEWGTYLLEHATTRASLRAKVGRRAFSETTDTALRSIRDGLDALLAVDSPEPASAPSPTVDSPAPVAPSTPLPAAQPRRVSDQEWLALLHQETIR
jgi:signal peptide peptidase SppA